MSGDASQGLWFEDLEPGSVFRHPLRRTVGEFDNILFSSLTITLSRSTSTPPLPKPRLTASAS